MPEGIDSSSDELPAELRCPTYPAWLRYGLIVLSLLACAAGAHSADPWLRASGLWGILLPGFIIMCARRYRGVNRVRKHVREIAESMTAAELSVLVGKLEAGWDDVENHDMRSLRQLVTQRHASEQLQQ
jgi:uncharacterized membrane protein